MPWWSAVIGCSEKLSKINMDERVASDPTLVRDRALFIEGLFHIPHRTRTSDLENPPTTCHHLPHTGAEDRSHDRVCQGRLISASPFEPSCSTTPCSQCTLRVESAVSFGETPEREDSEMCGGKDEPQLISKNPLRWQVVGVPAWSLVRCRPFHVRPDIADAERSCTDTLELAHWSDSVQKI